MQKISKYQNIKILLLIIIVFTIFQTQCGSEDPSSDTLVLTGKIVFTGNDAHRDIYSINADGTNLTKLTDNTLDDQPSWSPDGTKIVFRSYRNGNDEIYVMNADGTNQTRLTNHTASDFRPTWSPNGTKIAFCSTRDTSNGDIYVMNADGTGVTRLFSFPVDSAYTTLAWSPDGTKIAYTYSNSAARLVYTMNTNGTNNTQLGSSITESRYPYWFPNSSKLLISAQKSGDTSLNTYTINADGTSATYTKLYSYQCMSPDGTKIITSLLIGSGFVASKLNGANAVTIFTAPAGFSVSEPNWVQ